MRRQVLSNTYLLRCKRNSTSTTVVCVGWSVAGHIFHLLDLTLSRLPQTSSQVLPKTIPIIFSLTNIFFTSDQPTHTNTHSPSPHHPHPPSPCNPHHTAQTDHIAHTNCKFTLAHSTIPQRPPTPHQLKFQNSTRSVLSKLD